MMNNVIYLFLFMDCGKMVEISMQDTDGVNTQKRRRRRRRRRKARGNKCLKLFNIC